MHDTHLQGLKSMTVLEEVEQEAVVLHADASTLFNLGPGLEWPQRKEIDVI